jgi:hypothetical protein
MFNLFSQKKQEALSPHDLRSPIVYFSEQDAWTIGDACEGTQIFGGTGSGKTSGSGATIARSFLASGFGGLVLTVKKDERENWERLCQQAGCSDALMVVSPESGFKFNFLDYELKRAGKGAGMTENLVSLFYAIMEIADRGKGGGSSDSYWDRTLKQLLRNAIDLLIIARGTLSVMDIHELIQSAPFSPMDVRDRNWQDSSFCFELIMEAEKKQKDRSREMDLEVTSKYWLSEFPNLAERTRSIIVSSFTSMADTFLRGTLRDMFCSTTNFVPELTQQGAIILLDLPIKEYGDIGLYAQVLFKQVWQQCTERRDLSENKRPVFLWADESQNFITDYDQLFQTTARSSRACTVYLSQNLPNYTASLGGSQGKSRVDSFMGNLQTKIFHANGDSTTNEWASNMVAKTRQYRKSMNSSTSQDGKIFMPDTVGRQSGMGHSETVEYQVLPHEFTTLMKGGHQNDLIVEGIIFQSGRVWKQSGKNYLHTAFKQT